MMYMCPGLIRYLLVPVCITVITPVRLVRGRGKSMLFAESAIQPSIKVRQLWLKNVNVIGLRLRGVTRANLFLL